MLRKVVCFAAVTLVVAAVGGPVCARVASKYEVLKLDSSDLRSTYVGGINNSGIVYGGGYHGVGGASGAFRRDMNTGVTQFTDRMTSAQDMNAGEAAVGLTSLRNGVSGYCVWNADGTVTDLPAVNGSCGSGVRISDAGTVLGYYTPALGTTSTYFLWDAEHGMDALSLPQTRHQWAVRDLNNTGSYLGYSDGRWEASEGSPVPENVTAVWCGDGTYYDIGATGGPFCDWQHINDLNQVAGRKYVGDFSHVMRWDPVGGAVDVTAGVNGSFNLIDLNNAGQILMEGSIRDQQGQPTSSGHYIWDPTDGLVRIEDLIDPASGVRLSSLLGFNDQGWIVSATNDIYTFQHRDGVVLRPVTTPEPSGVIAMLVGFVGFVGVVRRKGNSQKV